MRNKLFFLLISIIFLSQTENATAQTVEETYALAKEKFAQNQYPEAIKLYSRVLYFHVEADSFKSQVHAGLASAHLKNNQYKESEIHFTNAMILCRNDSLTQILKLQRSKTYLLQHQYVLAQT